MVLITRDFFSIKLQKNYKKGEKVSFTKELEIHYIESGCAEKVAKKTKEKKIEIKKK